MEFYTERDDFKPGKHNIVGILFDVPTFKRKSLSTSNSYGEKHWYFCVFISGNFPKIII